MIPALEVEVVEEADEAGFWAAETSARYSPRDEARVEPAIARVRLRTLR